MKRIVLCLSIASALIACKKDNVAAEETFTTGTTSIMVEESVAPLADDMISVFTSQYDKADFKITVSHEADVMNAIFQDSVRLAIIPRDLTATEKSSLASRVQSIVTPIAKEAILFIGNKSSNDTLIQYDQFIASIKDSNNEKIYVFDNINSSLVRKIKQDAGISKTGKNIYFLETTKQVIEYISKNKNAVGIVGHNWLVQPDETIEEYKKSIRGLYVYNPELKEYFKATQSTIADNTYPLTRTINIIDVKGNAGLGKGLSSFASGDRGQRLVLKSGLLPITMPTREININQQ